MQSIKGMAKNLIIQLCFNRCLGLKLSQPLNYIRIDELITKNWMYGSAFIWLYNEIERSKLLYALQQELK